jgi:hypothetical protein
VSGRKDIIELGDKMEVNSRLPGLFNPKGADRQKKMGLLSGRRAQPRALGPNTDRRPNRP